ncbi:hypothetical protein BWK58_06840, partial [Flavobacterium columnare]
MIRKTEIIILQKKDLFILIFETFFLDYSYNNCYFVITSAKIGFLIKIMSKKVKYYYDTESLAYRKIKPKKGRKVGVGILF